MWPFPLKKCSSFFKKSKIMPSRFLLKILMAIAEVVRLDCLFKFNALVEKSATVLKTVAKKTYFLINPFAHTQRKDNLTSLS